MATNNVFYDFTGNPPGVVIDTTTAPSGVNPTTNAPDVDDIRITSNGGTGPITNLSLNAASGDDTATFSGSPNGVEARMAEGNDIVNVQTALQGGSIVSSEFIGGPGNDTFNIIANGAGAANTRFNGNSGADDFYLGGSFSQTTVAGSTGRDLTEFTKNSTFSSGFIGAGADDDTIRDNGFTVDFAATVIRAGAGDDSTDIKNSTVGTGTDGLNAFLGSGDDEFFGTKTGENSVEGGSGDDFIQTFADGDSILAGAGADTVLSGDGDDFVFAGADHDIVFGQNDEDTLNGGGGTDIVGGGADDDLIFGGPDGDLGDDTLIGDAGDDTVVGSSGDNWIFGDGLRSIAPGPAGNNAQFIDADFVSAFGTNFAQVNATLAGPNPLAFTNINPPFGNGFSIGSNYFFNVTGLDPLAIINGSQTPTADQINYYDNDLRPLLLNEIGNFVAEGSDSLVGNSGDDVIFGGGNDDTLNGNNGDDTLIAGTGSDIITGGSGNDLFIQEFTDSTPVFNIDLSFSGYNVRFDNPLTAAVETPDVITDFVARNTAGQVVDQISFERTGFGAAISQSLNNNIGNATGGFLAGQVVLYSGIYNENNGTFITSSDTVRPDGTTPLDVLAFRAVLPGPTGGPIALGALGSNSMVLLEAADQGFNNQFGNAGNSNFV